MIGMGDDTNFNSIECRELTSTYQNYFESISLMVYGYAYDVKNEIICIS